MDAAKVPAAPPPPIVWTDLALIYQTPYAEYRAALAANDAPAAEAKHREFLQALRVYQIAAR